MSPLMPLEERIDHHQRAVAVHLARGCSVEQADAMHAGLARLIAERDGPLPAPANSRLIEIDPRKSVAERRAVTLRDEGKTPCVQWYQDEYRREGWAVFLLGDLGQEAIELVTDHSRLTHGQWLARRASFLGRLRSRAS